MYAALHEDCHLERANADRKLRTVFRDALFSFGDDATVVGAGFALQPAWLRRRFEERLSALEAQLENKTIEQHFREHAELIDRRFAESFREQAELIDRLFVYRFEGLDKKLDAKLDARLSSLENRLDAKLAALGESLESRVDARIEAKVKPLKADLAIIKHAVGVLLTRLT